MLDIGAHKRERGRFLGACYFQMHCLPENARDKIATHDYARLLIQILVNGGRNRDAGIYEDCGANEAISCVSARAGGLQEALQALNEERLTE